MNIKSIAIAAFIAASTAGAHPLPATYDAELDYLQKAFPTAEGFGKYAQGGREGDVYIVTNLNDSGPGSLRECAEASGRRTCVFAVSGEIKAETSIRIRNPYITIAGQTAPGDGIMLTIRDTDNMNYPLSVEASHVIIRYIRSRPGPSRQKSSNVKGILVGGFGVKHVILDHVSMSWATDETLTVIGNKGFTNHGHEEGAQNITVQWSMIYESLHHSNHKKGPHSRSTNLVNAVQDFTFHHNIIANSNRRNPNVGVVGQFDFINNVVFDSGLLNGEVYTRHGTGYINWIGNAVIAGQSTRKKDNLYQASFFNNQDMGGVTMYVKDNIDIHRPANTGDERLVINPLDWADVVTGGPVGYGGLSLPASEITGPEQAYKDVLAFAGATLPVRDSADSRFVADMRNCIGKIIDHPDEVGGWPVLHSQMAPADTDQDGMPDSWETANGLNPNDPQDRNWDNDHNGYTNLEEYLNELAGDDAGSKVGTASGDMPDVTCGYSFAHAEGGKINSFAVSPEAVKPGETITVSWDAEGTSCKRSWAVGQPGYDPYQMSGTETVTIDESTLFSLMCQRSNVYDWETRYVFVNPEGEVPVPAVMFSASEASVDYGDSVTLSWSVGETDSLEAGECVASGAWDGYKTVFGQETFAAKNSGDYFLTCTGPGGTGIAGLHIDVNGGSVPPPNGGCDDFGIGCRVSLNSPANLRDENLAGTGEQQPTGAEGTIIDGPIAGDKNNTTQFWEVDFDNDPDGWVRNTQLNLED